MEGPAYVLRLLDASCCITVCVYHRGPCAQEVRALEQRHAVAQNRAAATAALTAPSAPTPASTPAAGGGVTATTVTATAAGPGTNPNPGAAGALTPAAGGVDVSAGPAGVGGVGGMEGPMYLYVELPLFPHAVLYYQVGVIG